MRRLSLPLLLVAMLSLWSMLERSPDERKDGVELRWVINSQERDVRFAEAARADFERQNPGIRIRFIKQNEGRKVETMIAGGDAPDIVSVGIDRVHYYRNAGVLKDLAPFLSEDDRRDLASFFPISLEPFRSRDRLYAMPWGYVPFLVFYNRALFDRAGISYPREGWTWEDYRRAARLLTQDTDGDRVTDQFGADFARWQDGYYSWFFQNGADLLTQDGQRTTFSSEKSVAVVQFLWTLAHSDRVMPTESNPPRQAGMGLFESGRLAMHGPTGSFYIPTYRDFKTLDWDIASAPAGPAGRGTIVAPIGFGVTSQSRHPLEAWKLVRFLASPVGQRILAESGLFVPCRRSVALSKALLESRELPRNRYALVAMMDDRQGKKPWGRLPPWSGNRWADVQDEALNPKLGSFLFGAPKAGATAQGVCSEIDRRANEILADARRESAGSPMPWRTVWLLSVLCGASVLALWIGSLRLASGVSKRARTEQRWGYLAIAPWLAGFLLLTLGPILVSLLMSFTRWDSLAAPASARFVGFDNYAAMLSGRDESFLKSLRATALYSALSLPVSLVGGLVLALLVNEKLRGMAAFRTIFYLPAVLPLVATSVLFGWLFRQQGLLNYLLGGFGAVPFQRMPNWLGDPAWAVPSVTLMNLWGVGGGMMITLAGLQSIPTQLYEAARIDGANAFASFRSVTLPMLSPTLFFNLVVGLIGSFQVFSSAFVLFGGSAGPDDSALFYSFYLYRKAFEQFQVGYGSALAWVLFAIVLALTALVFRSSSFWVYYESERKR